MSRFCAWLVALGIPWLSLTAHVEAAPAPLLAAPLTARSSSGQFLIYGGSDALPASPRRGDEPLLTPSLTAASCERIKTALLTKLGAPDRYQGRVNIHLVPAKPGVGFALRIVPFMDGWQYQVQVPERAERRDFVRAMVRTLLLEMANRTARTRSAEVPYWLAEGLTDELMSSSCIDLLVNAPNRGNTLLPISSEQRMISARDGVYRGILPMAGVHECLTTNPPLSVQQLSWPANTPDMSVDSPAYRASAQLLVHDLLELPDGPVSLQAFILGLPKHFNWQTTFLQAFAAHFQSLRDVEKWWLLQTSLFTSRTKFQRWSPVESWRQLDAVLRAPVQIRVNSNSLPTRGSVTLQTALNSWGLEQQLSLLSSKVTELGSLLGRMAPALPAPAGENTNTNAPTRDPLSADYDPAVASITEEYRLVLSTYFNALTAPPKTTRRGAPEDFSPRILVRNATRKLDELDARRRVLEASAARRRPDLTTSGSSGRVP